MCARMHGLGRLGVEISSEHDGNIFPHTHLSPISNIIGGYFHLKLTSKKAGEVNRLGFYIDH